MTHSRPLFELCAGDLMTRDVVVIPDDMRMAEAAEMLLKNSIHGAPVVDSDDRCVGILSFQDVAMWGARRSTSKDTSAATCMFHRPVRDADGGQIHLCSLPEGACRLQRVRDSRGGSAVVCIEPHCVSTDWQLSGDMSADLVSRFMTTAPIIAGETTSIQSLARLMMKANVHRLIVTDGDDTPVGVISATDLIAALAYADVEQERACIPA